MDTTPTIPKRSSLFPLAASIAVAVLLTLGSGCTEQSEEVVTPTPLTDEARAAVAKNGTTIVQFRFHGSIPAGRTLCLQLAGFAPIVAPPSGDKFRVNVALPLPDDFGFYFYESTESDCSVVDNEVWPGPREALVAALRAVPLATACADRGDGNFEVRATITDYNAATFTGGSPCPTAQEARVLVFAKDFEEAPEAGETVCLQVDGDATYAVPDSGGRYNHFIDDVPYNSSVSYRWWVSSESDCSTVVRYLYPGDARISVGGLDEGACFAPNNHPTESWHQFTVNGSGAAAPSTAGACPAEFSSEDKFEENHSVAGGDNSDWLGTSVAVAGARMIVGADRSDRFGRYAGAAYIYRQDRDGGWGQEAVLTPASAADWDRFGASAGLTDDTAAVGLWQRSPDGAVSVFERVGTSWAETALLTPNDGTGRDSFGHAVGISGEAIVVGAPYADRNGNTETGAAYIYEDVAGWALSATLTRSGTTAAGDRFGWAVAIDGDVAAVSAPYAGETGTVYVYQNNGGSWTEQATLTAPEGESAGAFGTALSVDGTRLVVGDSSGAGSVFVYDFDGSTWNHSASLRSASVAPADRFGESVGVAGDRVVVGAFRSTPSSASRAGSVHVFEWDGASWDNETVIVQSDGDAGDRFGYAVDIAPSVIVATAIKDDGAGTDSGAAYTFD